MKNNDEIRLIIRKVINPQKHDYSDYDIIAEAERSTPKKIKCMIAEAMSNNASRWLIEKLYTIRDDKINWGAR